MFSVQEKPFRTIAKGINCRIALHLGLYCREIEIVCIYLLALRLKGPYNVTVTASRGRGGLKVFFRTVERVG